MLGRVQIFWCMTVVGDDDTATKKGHQKIEGQLL